MGVSVVARYSTLVEADVACSALRSAGFGARVLEGGMATVLWTHQTALGGLRVAVPNPELKDAVDYLAAIHRAPRRPRPHPRDRGVIWRLVALLFGLVLGADAGWLVIGARDRMAPTSALKPWDIALVAMALAVLIAAASLIVSGLEVFIDSWLIHPQI